MSIENCLILAAGHGTRMGKLSEKVPKPLLPLFEKKLIEIIIFQLQKLGINNITVNSHHLSDQLDIFAKENPYLRLQYEPVLLNTGGSILEYFNQHNCDQVLVVNSDIILDLNSDLLKNLEDTLSGDVALLCHSVRENEPYNRLSLDNGYVTEIIKYKEGLGDGVTYSGVSLVKNPRVLYQRDSISFFESVANPAQKKVNYLHQNIPSYDFGTAFLYYENHFNILKEGENHPLFNLLVESGAIDSSKIKELSYNSSIKEVINLTNENPQISQSIVISTLNDQIDYKDAPKIIMGDLVEYC